MPQNDSTSKGSPFIATDGQLSSSSAHTMRGQTVTGSRQANQCSSSSRSTVPTFGTRGTSNAIMRCTRHVHVCAECEVSGCVSCNKTCHANSTSELCPYYGRNRGALDWQPNAQDAQDTLMHQSELRGHIRHRTESSFVNDSVEKKSKINR